MPSHEIGSSASNRPSYAISKHGSSFGSEEIIEERWCTENLQHMRELWSLNDEQYRELVSIKDKIADIDHWKNNPYEVIRYVMGPQGYGKAEELFRTMINWRIENNIDTILQTYRPPKILLDYLPSAILAGYDKEGDPIYLERGGSIDGQGLLNRYGRGRLMKHIIWSRELASRGRWIEEYEKKMKRPPTRLTIVYDLSGLGTHHLKAGVLPFLNESMRITQQRYNGLAKKMIIIRAPSLFNVVWGICKHAFPKGAVKKMVFSGPNNYLDVLDKYIDREVLPPCIVSDGKGEVAIDMPSRLDGGLIPVDDISVDSDEIAAAEAAKDGYESSTSFETWPDSDIEPLVRSRGKQVCFLKVRCKRIVGGCWVSNNQSSSKAIQVFD